MCQMKKDLLLYDRIFDELIAQVLNLFVTLSHFEMPLHLAPNIMVDLEIEKLSIILCILRVLYLKDIKIKLHIDDV